MQAEIIVVDHAMKNGCAKQIEQQEEVANGKSQGMKQ